MTVKLCQFCDDETPAVARIAFAWTLSDGERREAEKNLCADHMRSKREEFTNGSEDGPKDPAFEVLEEFDDAALEALASGQLSEELVYEHASGIRFVWQHGSRIEVFGDASDSVPVESLSVYDYGKGAITISTYEEFKGECNEWVDSLDDHDRKAYASEAFWQNRGDRG
ncbi:hypothetical protein [Streptomyces sp. H27-C3]|uniref:hypothetical protein n=1 Tax=Streptomyces sp. H27-C3 TaxID=3046305 RepID=UPI0024BA965D|nr:hypothetical protein [Streptomyces sp. H27-C3]MDJ0463093.1 hypothetical protein [Streptomyces sp. H27-C3]